MLAGCSHNSFVNDDSIGLQEATVDPSQLPIRDIHLPGMIAWWPPALGWWIVAAVALAALVAFALYYAQCRHRRAALRSLASVRAALEQGAEPVACSASRPRCGATP